jgi:hypothetical protein
VEPEEFNDDESVDKVSIQDLVECLLAGDMDGVERYIETSITTSRPPLTCSVPDSSREKIRGEIMSLFRQLMKDKGIQSVKEDIELVTRPVFGVESGNASICGRFERFQLVINIYRCDEKATCHCKECSMQFCYACAEFVHEIVG